MIYLTSSLSIQMDLSGAPASTAPECHASFIDETPVSTTEKTYKDTSGATQRSVTNGTTDVVVVSSPAQGVVRAVESIMFNNLDSAAVTLRMWTDDGTDERELFGSRSVAAGEIVFYEHGSGWGIV